MRRRGSAGCRCSSRCLWSRGGIPFPRVDRAIVGPGCVRGRRAAVGWSPVLAQMRSHPSRPGLVDTEPAQPRSRLSRPARVRDSMPARLRSQPPRPARFPSIGLRPAPYGLDVRSGPPSCGSSRSGTWWPLPAPGCGGMPLRPGRPARLFLLARGLLARVPRFCCSPLLLSVLVAGRARRLQRRLSLFLRLVETPPPLVICSA